MPRRDVCCLLFDLERKAIRGNAFSVKVAPTATIEALKEKVKKKRPNALERIDPADLTVWRCTDPKLDALMMNQDELQDRLTRVDFKDTNKVKELSIRQKISALVELSEDEILLIEVLAAVPGEDRRRHELGGGGSIAGSAGGGANDCEEFRAHGYELQPELEDLVDEKGCKFEPLFPLPANIRTVHRLPRVGKALIAKKVHADSDETAILKLLNNSHPKSEHVISLLDSFRTRSGQWIILPKLNIFNECLIMNRGRIRGQIAPICWGLIKGLSHLHRLCIAHRDIKPNNLVLDANADYCLKIIDFEFAMQMKDENEEVDEICGTEPWMAPEVKKALSCSYSPIKADRWACGRFILYIFDKLKEEDVVLKAVGSMLKVDDPQQRPSLLEWQNWTSSLLIDGKPNGKAAPYVVKVIPQVRRHVVEYGESGDVKRHRPEHVD